MRRARRRIEEEQWIGAGAWSCWIEVRRRFTVRGAELQADHGRAALPRGTGSGVVSRIHVDDLAAVLEAGILSNIEGAGLLADDHPCSSEEIAAWCARLLRLSGIDWRA